MLRRWLAHPLTRGLDLNDPQTTELRRRIVREKQFLRLIYEEWYGRIVQALPPGPEPVLELGSGAGFLHEFVPALITSEIFHSPDVGIVMDGTRLPVADGALRSIVMTDVLHHIPDVRGFFSEATRCVRVGGRIVMIEPWVTSWSRLIYTHLHHEPFEPEAADWAFPFAGPLSGANGALPWIVFARDRKKFESDFPEWRIVSVTPVMPFRYLVSGGVAMRSTMPSWSFGWWRSLEKALDPWVDSWAMFAVVVLERANQKEKTNA